MRQPKDRNRLSGQATLERLEQRQLLDASPTTTLWTTYVGGGLADQAAAVATDGAGNILLAGVSRDNASSPVAPGKPFIAKLSPSGVPLWMKYPWDDGSGIKAFGITADRAGNVWVVGSRTTGYLTAPFVAKLDPTGNQLRQTYLAPPGSTKLLSDIAVDEQGNARVAGTLGELRGPFVAKIGGAGDVLWTSAVGTSQYKYFGGGRMVLDSAGDAHFAFAAIESSAHISQGLLDDGFVPRNIFLTTVDASGHLSSDGSWGNYKDSKSVSALGIDVDGGLLLAGGTHTMASRGARGSGADTTFIYKIGGSSGSWQVNFAGWRTVTALSGTPRGVYCYSSYSSTIMKIERGAVAGTTAIAPVGSSMLAIPVEDGMGGCILAGTTSKQDRESPTNTFQGGDSDAFIARITLDDMNPAFMKVTAKGTDWDDSFYISASGDRVVVSLDGRTLGPFLTTITLTLSSFDGHDRYVISPSVTSPLIIIGSFLGSVVSGAGPNVTLGRGVKRDDPVNGTTGSDSIHVSRTADGIVVAVNGQNSSRFIPAEPLVIHGLGGDDNITIDPEVSFRIEIFGDDGNDTISAGSGTSSLYGGSGDDSLAGGNSADLLEGGEGDDTLLGNGGNDTLYGHDGPDLLDGGAGADELYGNPGDDTLDGGQGRDVLKGGGGADSLLGMAGQDSLYGGDDSDTIQGNDGNDYIEGRGKADTIHGGIGNDTIYGGAGADSIAGDAGDDWIDAGPSPAFVDRIDGGEGTDTVLADANDLLAGVEVSVLE